MDDLHQQWLKQMEAESLAKQETFMNGIAEWLKRPRITEQPSHPFKGAPDFWNAFAWPMAERIERFMENLTSLGGHATRLADLNEAKDWISVKAEELGVKRIVRQRQPELAVLDLESAIPGVEISVWNSDGQEWIARAEEADMGLVVADYAVAYTGSIVLLSSRDQGRAVSLLPNILTVIIPIDRLKTRVGEVLALFDQLGPEQLPAGIHFISGPSRSSDIENDLTIGIHGPGVVYALIVG